MSQFRRICRFLELKFRRTNMSLKYIHLRDLSVVKEPLTKSTSCGYCGYDFLSDTRGAGNLWCQEK